MHIAHPIIAGFLLVASMAYLIRRALSTRRIRLRGRGPPIYRRWQPVRYWSSIIVMSAFFGLGVVLVLWGLLSPE